ncbi:MAG TPA: hypothetical protein ENN07_03740, partial [candidate division Zixibacteria bacterium]|nr:hypothetical protein [candidate division Zixibacteria bacterium]
MSIQNSIKNWAIDTYKTTMRIYKRFTADDGMTTAGALSFYFLMSILPMTLLGLSIFGYILGSPTAAVSAITTFGKIDQIFPEGTLDVEGILADLVMGKQVIGIIGLLMLLWFSGSVFETVEHTVNRVFRVTVKRGFIRRTLIIYSFLL